MSRARIVNILVSSVGGQGGLTLSRVLATASALSGYSVRTGETLGMAQRFGSVVSYVRIGVTEEVYSPLFDVGEAHYMVCMEIIECARSLKYLSGEGLLILDKEIKPPTSMTVAGSGPGVREELLKRIREAVGSDRLLLVPAKEIALRLGASRAANMVLLGALNNVSKLFKDEVVAEAIAYSLSSKAVKSSLLAYNEGVNYVKALS